MHPCKSSYKKGRRSRSVVCLSVPFTRTVQCRVAANAEGFSHRSTQLGRLSESAKTRARSWLSETGRDTSLPSKNSTRTVRPRRRRAAIDRRLPGSQPLARVAVISVDLHAIFFRIIISVDLHANFFFEICIVQLHQINLDPQMQ